MAVPPTKMAPAVQQTNIGMVRAAAQDALEAATVKGGAKWITGISAKLVE